MPRIGSITPETEEKRHKMGAKIWIGYLTNLVKHINDKKLKRNNTMIKLFVMPKIVANI